MDERPIKPLAAAADTYRAGQGTQLPQGTRRT